MWFGSVREGTRPGEARYRSYPNGVAVSVGVIVGEGVVLAVGVNVDVGV